MASTRDIKRRISSVKNTAQITKAMQLVAASKMKRAQDQTVATRPYAKLLHEFVQKLSTKNPDYVHPLMEIKKEGKSLYVVISTDKGLCGGLNTNLFRKILKESREIDDFVTIGKKAKGVFSKLKNNLIADFEVDDPIPFSKVKLISKFVIEKFLEDNYEKIYVCFSDFVSTLRQEPTIEQLFPLTSLDVEVDIKGVREVGDSEKKENDYTGYIYEPNEKEIFTTLIPQVVQFRIFQMFLEARASEHSARMVSMKSATDNANDLVKSLTLQYNRIRQEAITNELLDITTAMRALE